MPWKAIKGGGCSGSKPYAVVKVDGGRVACHETLEKAQAQVRALYANDAMAAVVHTGDTGMVAVFPDLEEAQKIAHEDGQAVSDLHVTLCFLPYSADLKQIGPILAGLAAEYDQLHGKLSGVGVFHKNENGVPTVGLPSVVGLDKLRVDVARALDDAGIVYAINYGWLPHMTLGYDLTELPTVVLGEHLSFNAVTFMDSDKRHDYAFRVPKEKTTDSASNLSQTSEVILVSETTLANGNGSPVTITVTTNEPSQETTASWEGILAVEGSPSSDRRYLIPTEISARELPLPLRVVTSDEGGHDNAVQAGRIEDIQHIPIADFARREEFNLTNVSDNAIVIWAQGVFDGPDDAVSLAQTMMRNGAGVSLDLPHDRLALIDPETFEEIAEEDIELADALSGKYLTGIAGKIAAATIVDIPAFEEATIRLSDGQAIVASAFGLNLREGLVASAGKAPLAPPRAWFEMPEPNGPTPLTITEDGQVYGHLATWNQCHASFPGSCELAPRSKSGYQYFHLGAIETAEGGTVPVGRVTVGKANEKVGGHNWDLWSGAKGAIEHYDRTGAVAAFVRARDGKHGIWLCGATRSDAPPEAIRDMRANPPSGDWRYENGGLELVAALSVPVPGFPVPYLVASSGDQVTTLIMPPYEGTEEEVLAEVGPRSAIRRMAILSARGREALAVDTKTCPNCGDSIPMDATTCPECGYDMEDAAEGDMAKKKDKMPPIPVPADVPETTPVYADENKDEKEENEAVAV